jgi:hypothetical protein
MELWHIIVICLMLFPLFLIANYIIVKRAARGRRSMDDRLERAISARVARSMGAVKSADKFKPKPRFGSRQKR